MRTLNKQSGKGSFPHGNDEPLLNLQYLVNEIYDRGGYALRVNYQEPPVPRLTAPETRHQVRVGVDRAIWER
ncbi:MAG: DUF4058 family protein [Cyanothece sp. SIO2G6]|nr:DUF4058 family protein [Cyanothece sp. SIO2G6]